MLCECGCACHIRIDAMANAPGMKFFLTMAAEKGLKGLIAQLEEQHRASCSPPEQTPADLGEDGYDPLPGDAAGAQAEFIGSPTELNTPLEDLRFPADGCRFHSAPPLVQAIAAEILRKEQSDLPVRIDNEGKVWPYCDMCHDPKCPWCYPDNATPPHTPGRCT